MSDARERLQQNHLMSMAGGCICCGGFVFPCDALRALAEVEAERDAALERLQSSLDGRYSPYERHLDADIAKILRTLAEVEAQRDALRGTVLLGVCRSYALGNLMAGGVSKSVNRENAAAAIRAIGIELIRALLSEHSK